MQELGNKFIWAKLSVIRSGESIARMMLIYFSYHIKARWKGEQIEIKRRSKIIFPIPMGKVVYDKRKRSAIFLEPATMGIKNGVMP